MLFGPFGGSSFGGFFGDSTMGKAVGMALDLCLLEEMEKEDAGSLTDTNWLDEDDDSL